MKAPQIDAFISTLIDEVKVTAQLDDAAPDNKGDAGLGHLLAHPTPLVDDTELLTLLTVVVHLRNFADTLLSRVADAAERVGIPARRRDTITSMLTSIGVPPVVAHRAVKVGRAQRTLPTLDATTGDARLSGEHAAAVVTGLGHITTRAPDLDADERQKLVSNLVAQAISGTPNDVTVWARKTALELVPADAPTPIAENRDLNEMSVSIGDDGRTHAQLDLDTLAGEKLRVALDPLTVPTPEPDGSADPRSAAQRTADAFEQIVDTYLRGRNRPHSGGQLPHVCVTIPQPAAQAAPVTPSARLDGGQPLSQATAAMIACDCDLTAMTVDVENVPLDISRTQRLFPPELRQALVVRDQGCCFPGCGRPPSWCQAHHVKYWRDGGETSLNNGALLCQRHHTMIHHTDWQMQIGVDYHPWFLPPPTPAGRGRPDGPRAWIRSHARRTLTTEATAAA